VQLEINCFDMKFWVLMLQCFVPSGAFCCCRLEKIEENNQAYLNKGTIAVSPAMEQLLEPLPGTGLHSSGNAT
jgi:hypothetical protein